MSDAGEVKCLIEGSSRISRSSRLRSCFSSGSVVSSFLVGLVSGAAGGLLLGAMAAVLLQALELLDGNKLLMEKLQIFLLVGGNVSRGTCNEQQLNFGASALAEAFAVGSSLASAAVGICAGLSVHMLVTRWSRGAEAVVVAGAVCLTCAAASGSVLGLTMETFLYLASTVDYSMWLSVSLFIIGLTFGNLLILNCLDQFELSSSFFLPIIVLILTPGTVYTIMLTAFFFKTKLVLLMVLVPVVCGLYRLENTHDFHLTTSPVLLMLALTELFNIANLPIVASQPPAGVGAVHEGVFVGVLTSQMFTAAVGMSLVASWQKGEAGTVCAAAAGCGAAVLAAVELALPWLGPGPTVGALVGAAGAVGVSLSAAATLAGPCGLVGRAGVTVGAAAGAVVSSCSHGGLSPAFMALCAAALPAGLALQQILGSVPKRWTRPNLRLFWCLMFLTAVLMWLNFACTDWPDSLGLIPLALIPFVQWLVLLVYTLNMDK